MMILALGRKQRIRTARAAGFSLLEMLLVLMVIGLLYAGVGSLLSLSVSDPLKEEVERLRQHIRLAQDESVVRSQALALGFDDAGYAFFVLSDQPQKDQPWELLKTDKLFRFHTLPDRYEQVLYLQGQSVVLGKLHAQVFILPSGEMTPFEWRLREKNGHAETVTFDNNGQLQEVGNAAQ